MQRNEKKYVYLCSRVAHEARPLNEKVAEALEKAGYEVYVPHAQPFNNHAGSTDQEIFQQDLDAMLRADLCVIVGRIGVDCAFEVGHFQARNVPTFWFQQPTNDRHPMFYKVSQRGRFNNTYSLITAIDSIYKPIGLLRFFTGAR